MVTLTKYKLETIDIRSREWFDRVNGNSYFSATIHLNYGKRNEKEIILNFQYGYGEHYIDIANQTLIKKGYIVGERNDNGSYEPLWRYCNENNITLRTFKQENCKKRELQTQ